MQLWYLYALCSALFAALVAIFAKLGFNVTSGLDSVLATTVRAVIMALFLLIVCAALNKAKFISSFDTKAYLFIFLSGIAGALSWLCYFAALQQAPTEFVSAVAALDRFSIVFVVLFSVLFLGTNFTWYSVAGSILVIAGTILLMRT
jgi:bacterial/archaeal transporter family protein